MNFHATISVIAVQDCSAECIVWTKIADALKFDVKLLTTQCVSLTELDCVTLRHLRGRTFWTRKNCALLNHRREDLDRAYIFIPN